MRPTMPRAAHACALALFAVLSANAAAPSSAQDAPAPPAGPVAPTPDASPWRTEARDLRIPMRDQASLAANLLLPKVPGRYPAIVVQTPYDKDRMGRETGAARDAGEAGRGSEKAWARFDRDHYAYLFVDWRGFHGSKDAMAGVDRRAWRRGLDGYDVVEWAAAQPWCDGKVGTWGGSALGKQQFDTAAERPPHLVCAAPLIAAMGQRYEAYYEGGVPLEAHTRTLDALGFGVGQAVAAAPLPSAAVWRLARERTFRPERIEVPCLLVSGWFDHFPREVVETFEAIVARGGEAARAESRLVMGPWSHTLVDLARQGDLEFPAADGYSTTLTLRFFDRFLRGVTEGWDEVPRVHAFQTGEERWATAARWADLVGPPVSFALRSDGVLAREGPPPAEAGRPALAYRYDPRSPSPTVGGRNMLPLTHGPKEVSALLAREDGLVWSTPPLEAPLATRGEAEVSLLALCDRPDVDLCVRLCDTFPDGRSYLVGETILRASLRDGERARPLAPGEPFRPRLRFPPHAWTWGKGHRATLLLTSGSWPRYERNPHTGSPRWDEAAAHPVEVTVLLGPGDATLSLPSPAGEGR